MNSLGIGLLVLFFVIVVFYWKFLKGVEILADVLLVGMSASLLFIFSQFALYGKIFAYEPNTGIAVAEFIMIAVILLIGIERFIDDIQNYRE